MSDSSEQNPLEQLVASYLIPTEGAATAVATLYVTHMRLARVQNIAPMKRADFVARLNDLDLEIRTICGGETIIDHRINMRLVQQLVRFL